jgi:putative aldouronate transport system permease protein
MVIKRSIGERIFDTINVIAMIALMAVTLYPLLHVLFASISRPSLLIQHRGLLLWPLGIETGSYGLVFKNPMIVKGYANTMFVVFAGTIINIVMTSLGAYVLSRKNVYWKNFIMMIIVFTMFFGGGMIPTYLIVKSLKLTNTLLALIIPNAISTYNLIIMRTSFMSIPDSLEESARIDGAQDFTILFKIIIPLSMPVIAVMILFYGVGHWNSWFAAMIYLRKRELYPLQLILREILISSDINQMMTEVGGMDREPVALTVKYATIVVATLPILCIYPFLQKYFVKGVMIGALKG